MCLPLCCRICSKIQRLIANGHVVIDAVPAAKPSLSVESGQQITVFLPRKTPADEPRPQALDLDVIYEDDDLAVINKPAGLVVHRGAGQHEETLVNGLLHRYGKTLSQCGGSDRPGIVHRLDKGTSGIMIKPTPRSHTSSPLERSKSNMPQWFMVAHEHHLGKSIWPLAVTETIEQRFHRTPTGRVMLSLDGSSSKT